MASRAAALLLLLLPAAAPATAQVSLPPLSFLGFEAGVRLEAMQMQVRALGGKGLRCDRSRRDLTVRECRATLFHPVSGRPVELWASTMDSAAGILTLSGPVNGIELDAWRSELVTAFGQVGAWVQGPQWMLQWVRQGRMLRLTWRIQQGENVASVSLVDGLVLDGWGQRWEATHPRSRDSSVTAPSAPAPDPADSASTR